MSMTSAQKQYNELNAEQQSYAREVMLALEQGYRDPVFFSEYFLDIPLHEGQKKWLRNSDPVWNPETHLKNALAPCNRWGKTVTVAIKHIRFCFYKIGVDRDSSIGAMEQNRYATLDLSPHSNQVQACYNYIFDILHNRFITIHDGKRVVNQCKIQQFFVSKNDSKNRIKFSNNSEFFGASTGEDQGASLAGRQFGYISYDECVFSHHLRVELPARIMSRTIDLNAPIDLVSTFDAEAKSQQYYFGLIRKGLKQENDWYVQIGTFHDNYFIPEKTRLEAAEKIKAEDFSKYRQVFLGEAVASSRKVFEPEVIENIFRPGIVSQGPVPTNQYLISVDWGGSDHGDPTVMIVLNITTKPYYVVHHELIKGGSPTIQFATLRLLKDYYNDAKIIMDTNALGGVIIKKMLGEMGVRATDFGSHGGEKSDAVYQLKLALSAYRQCEVVDEKIVERNPEYGLLRSYYIPEMEEQLGSYEVNDLKLEQDWVVVLYQAMWYLQKKLGFEKSKTYVIGRNSPVKSI